MNRPKHKRVRVCRLLGADLHSFTYICNKITDNKHITPDSI